MQVITSTLSQTFKLNHRIFIQYSSSPFVLVDILRTIFFGQFHFLEKLMWKHWNQVHCGRFYDFYDWGHVTQTAITFTQLLWSGGLHETTGWLVRPAGLELPETRERSRVHANPLEHYKKKHFLHLLHAIAAGRVLPYTSESCCM